MFSDGCWTKEIFTNIQGDPLRNIYEFTPTYHQLFVNLFHALLAAHADVQSERQQLFSGCHAFIEKIPNGFRAQINSSVHYDGQSDSEQLLRRSNHVDVVSSRQGVLSRRKTIQRNHLRVTEIAYLQSSLGTVAFPQSVFRYLSRFPPGSCCHRIFSFWRSSEFRWCSCWLARCCRCLRLTNPYVGNNIVVITQRRQLLLTLVLNSSQRAWSNPL